MSALEHRCPSCGSECVERRVPASHVVHAACVNDTCGYRVPLSDHVRIAYAMRLAEGIRHPREITDDEENFRAEPSEHNPNIRFIRRDYKEPEPEGTYVLEVFRIEGYTKDCDGSAMWRGPCVNYSDEGTTGWNVDSLGLYRGSDIILDKSGLEALKVIMGGKR